MAISFRIPAWVQRMASEERLCGCMNEIDPLLQYMYQTFSCEEIVAIERLLVWNKEDRTVRYKEMRFSIFNHESFQFYYDSFGRRVFSEQLRIYKACIYQAPDLLKAMQFVAQNRSAAVKYLADTPVENRPRILAIERLTAWIICSQLGKKNLSCFKPTRISRELYFQAIMDATASYAQAEYA